MKKINFDSLGRKYGLLIEANKNYLRQGVNEWLDLTKKRIINALTKKYIKDAASDLVLKLTDWEEIESSGEKIFKPLILNIMQRGANAGLDVMEIREDFDILNSRSVGLAEDICAKLVVEVTDETQKAIATAARDRLAQGMGVREMAKDIRPLVGLTERQIRAVANKEEWLLVNRPELGPKEVARRVAVYENRLHRRRADMIARTESARAVSEGSLQGYAYAKLDEVIWNAAFEACPICAGLHGKRFKLNEASGMQPAHPL